MCSVDASNEDEGLGRLVNRDDFSPNCEMRKVVCEGKPHLCLFALREICPDDEITYSYGDLKEKGCSKVSFHTFLFACRSAAKASFKSIHINFVTP